MALLRTTVEASLATMGAVRHAAEADPASRKLFVHGLGWGAGADDLRSAFTCFGELEDCHVISDKQSGRSKGYCFVLFRSRRSTPSATPSSKSAAACFLPSRCLRSCPSVFLARPAVT
ncbi:hypothetical protein E2562_039164 [Oryza meyeriana var. granulata]|uniref:RRM domain-containing protein n=1 Tax=Oryza meyeriana var. granulata TaxID=110450 RepID=A0A6G1CMB6_9ORYZ|nr:hypothetical protein E2562_039164 [Oryza meyeriana var. granulata]